ncbi:MAG: SUMF1/EgtB/PvdO family nonheme iron enzyme [Armatimonadota bacterium]|nr:SUMF1/EgtB/PvdO family nonheme iron enzyme [bacterium]
MARLKITNTLLGSTSTASGTVPISFDITWEEAWRNETNCDGIWVFAKFKTGDGIWQHATIAEASGCEFNYCDHTPSGCSCGIANAPLAMWVPETRKGAFITRTQGEGDVSSTDVKISWAYSADGVTVPSDVVDIRVFGLEMVYVPEEKHYVGDPKGTNGPLNCLYTYPDGGAYLIESEAPISVDAKPGCLYCDQDNDRSRDETPFVIPDTFPKGYAAFWLMKYGVSSQQYVDFLNTLTRKQQQGRVLSDISGDDIPNYHVMTNTAEEYLRQSIVCQKQGNRTQEPVQFFTYAPARACNAISWGDVAAFAAWAALRPITELEFEKACRGPLLAVASECAWGSAEIGRADTFDGPDGSGYERPLPATGLVNCCYGGGIAPFRAAAGQTEPENPGFEGPVSCGVFSNYRRPGIPKRLNDGASYYGILELSGNLWEPCVTLGHPAGRAFLPNHGDGMLNEDGDAFVQNWPDKSGAGTGVRGGVWRSPDENYLMVALRFAANHAKSTERYNGGCRVGF